MVQFLIKISINRHSSVGWNPVKVQSAVIHLYDKRYNFNFLAYEFLQLLYYFAVVTMIPVWIPAYAGMTKFGDCLLKRHS